MTDLHVNGVIVSGGRNWVVCAPGDPNENQWAAIRTLASGRNFCAQLYNTNSGYVMVEVENINGDVDVYTVAAMPNVMFGTRYVTTVTADGEKVQR